MTRESEVIDAQQKARQAQEAEKQARFEKEQALYRETMDRIERAIAPLKFSPVKGNEGNPLYGYLSRRILSESGEELGHISYKRTGYSWKSKMKFQLTSQRISQAGRYSYRAGSRYYLKEDSALAAIKKFCVPTSTDETRAEVLRKELRHYRDVLKQAYKRSLTTDGTGYGPAPVTGFIALLASKIPQDRIEGAEYIRVLVRKKRVNDRFDNWVQETFINPRQDELDSLDLSKEKMR